MRVRLGRRGFEEWLDQTPGARELWDTMTTRWGWTEQQAMGEIVRRIQESRAAS